MINNQMNNISNGVQGNDVDETEEVVDEGAESPQPSKETAIVPKSWTVDPVLAGRVDVMRSNPRTAAETIAAIKTGDPAALEGMWLGAHPNGDPKISYIDDFGNPQYHNLTVSQWMAIKEARSLNRTKMVQYQEEQEQLQQSIEEYQGAFTSGLGMLDDGSNPMLSAVFKDMYSKDPIGTLAEMYDLRYLEEKDAHAAAAKKFQIVNDAMLEQSTHRGQQFAQGLERHFGGQYLELENRLKVNSNDPQLREALGSLETTVSSFKKGTQFKPWAGMDMSLSPGQAYTNPARRVDMYRTWMEMLSIGVPTATGQHRYTVNNPQDVDAWESERENLVMHLEWLSRQLGWQGSFIDPNTGMLNMEDEVAIRKAYHQIFNNPAVLMANQQANPALSSQGTQYQGAAQQGLPGGVPWAPGQASPTQQAFTPPPGSTQLQPLTPQPAPTTSGFKFDPSSGSAPFGDPLDLRLDRTAESLAAAKVKATDQARVDELERMKIKEQMKLIDENMSPDRLEADKLIQELQIENEKMLLSKLESMLAIADGLEPGDEKEFYLAVIKVLADNAMPEMFEKARAKIEADKKDEDK